MSIMAVNPAVLQYAAGVPAPPRFQLRRNLVTKKPKATPMCAAANPASVVLLVCAPPCQFHSVTKRIKTITAAYPTPQQYSTDIPEFTDLKVTNNSGQRLKLSFKNFWEGNKTASEDLPQKFTQIDNGSVGEFIHEADAKSTVIGSAGGLEYKIGNDGKYKWIITWSNSKNELNKVYSEIVKEEDNVDWDKIIANLRKSGKNHEGNTEEFSFALDIDATSAKATLEAKLDQKKEESENKNDSESPQKEEPENKNDSESPQNQG